MRNALRSNATGGLQWEELPPARTCVQLPDIQGNG